MRTRPLLVSLFSVVLFSIAQAQPAWSDPTTLRGLTRLFQSQFDIGYEEGRCGDNILGLARMARNQGLAVDEARILVIVNKGYSVFGMVNVEYARQSGRMLPESSREKPQYEPGERNWYHHVVMVYDGHVFDFDYGNTPRVEPAAAYFERMFLNEVKNPGYGGHYAGREEKLKTYEVESSSAREALEHSRNPARVTSLGALLKEF
jgi:hypothetical protein